MSYIVFSIPVFFLLIGIELLVDKLKGTHYYRFNDAITNLSCGVGSQVVGKVLLGTVTIVGYKFIYEHWRLFNMPSLENHDPFWQVFLVWIALFIGVDFFYYWFHRLAHEISFLWGSHIVHHQSEEYNLTVALRQAWLQGAFSWVFYLPLAFMGFDTAMFITIASFQTLYQFWIHTKMIDRLPRWFEYVLNTPSHHRVHHGVNPQYIDKNHGGTFIIFDRMFGTFAKEEEVVVYGITTGTDSWNPLWVNFEYWIALFKETFKVHRLVDGIKMLVLAPGWKPADMGGPSLPKPVTPATFHKYDTQIPNGLNYYVFVHYVLLIVGASLFLLFAKKMPYTTQLGATVGIIFVIVVIGGLLEKRSWSFGLEMVRLLAMAVLGAYALRPINPILTILPFLAAGGFIFWLYQYRVIFNNESQNLQPNTA